jgi:hypothetical protein
VDDGASAGSDMSRVSGSGDEDSADRVVMKAQGERWRTASQMMIPTMDKTRTKQIFHVASRFWTLRPSSKVQTKTQSIQVGGLGPPI